jgi:hypothetical protein
MNPKTAVETPPEESSSSDASVCHNGSCNLLGELQQLKLQTGRGLADRAKGQPPFFG